MKIKEEHIIRERITSRGGGIEIDLTDFGFEGEKMTAYQNYLGGGMLGSIQSDNTLKRFSFIDESDARKLDQISNDLKKYFYLLMHGDIEGYEETQRLPSSAY